mgnify:CR=1 FL=1
MGPEASVLSAVPDASLAQLLLVALVAFFSSIIGGLSGQGVGLILPVFVAPVVGIANVIPVMAVAALLTNLSRLAVFWREIDFPKARRVLMGALPGAIAGACYAATGMGSAGSRRMVSVVMCQFNRTG